jgi:hypothetical protein
METCKTSASKIRIDQNTAERLSGKNLQHRKPNPKIKADIYNKT